MGVASVGRAASPILLRNLWVWLAGLVPARKAAVRSGDAAVKVRVLALVAGGNPGAKGVGGQRPSQPISRPLRVLRVVDSHHAPTDAGRMVISGRMADVCAELERLASHETVLAKVDARRQA